MAAIYIRAEEYDADAAFFLILLVSKLDTYNVAACVKSSRPVFFPVFSFFSTNDGMFYVGNGSHLDWKGVVALRLAFQVSLGLVAN